MRSFGCLCFASTLPSKRTSLHLRPYLQYLLVIPLDAKLTNSTTRRKELSSFLEMWYSMRILIHFMPYQGLKHLLILFLTWYYLHQQLTWFSISIPLLSPNKSIILHLLLFLHFLVLSCILSRNPLFLHGSSTKSIGAFWFLAPFHTFWSTKFSNSISKEIGASVIFANSTIEIWQDLHTRFNQQNGPWLFQLKKDLMNLAQGSMSVTAYFTKLSN